MAKFRIIKYLLLGTGLFIGSHLLFSGFYPGGITDEKNPRKDEVLSNVILESLKRGHFQQQDLNDDFSKKAFDLYIKRLDFNRRFLLESDIDKFNSYSDKIDDAVSAGNYEFFELTISTLEERLDEAKTYYAEILNSPFDFTVNETIDTDFDKLPYAKTKEELKEGWRKSLKWQTLSRVVEMMENQEKRSEDDTSMEDSKSNSEEEDLTFEEMEEKARSKVLKSHDNWFNRLKKLNREDRLAIYLNSIINIYGPHTGYYPPKDKENFDIAMSGQLEGIGARLQEKDGYIKVSSIVPGSASYRQGELKEGDIILKVAQAEEEPVDVVDMPLDDAVKLIRGKKGSEVRLTVKKIDGSTTIIPIIRDVVIIEATYAKSAILEKDEMKGEKIGYIKLPKFYADFQRRGGRSCANDVEIELEKLKGENVDGIILDLRNNGGGSLGDAVKMAGLFFEKGPVVQVKSRYGDPEVLSDKDSKVQYDGPLVILVNSFSASASEILAAAIQDYKRGVVIGSNTSFGKGTVQRFYELDRLLPSEYSDVKPLGAIKVTTQKFYRINGDATQLKGVIPDIVLPDIYQHIETGEKEQDYVMPWDKISKVEYNEWKPGYSINELKKKSKKRISDDPVFNLIDENADWLKKRQDEHVYSMNLEQYRKDKEARKKESDKYENINKEIPGLSIANIDVDVEAMGNDTIKAKINEDWLKAIRKDAYVNEALYVLKDMK